MLGETHLAPELLTEPKLTITSTTHDGISTTREVKDLKLSAGSVLTHKLTVPERLASLTVVLQRQSRCPQCRWHQERPHASHTWNLNGIDKTEAVNDGHLSTFDGQRVFELLGKNGEPIADQQVSSPSSTASSTVCRPLHCAPMTRAAWRSASSKTSPKSPPKSPTAAAACGRSKTPTPRSRQRSTPPKANRFASRK
jgi:hypothetical protein